MAPLDRLGVLDWFPPILGMTIRVFFHKSSSFAPSPLATDHCSQGSIVTSTHNGKWSEAVVRGDSARRTTRSGVNQIQSMR